MGRNFRILKYRGFNPIGGHKKGQTYIRTGLSGDCGPWRGKAQSRGQNGGSGDKGLFFTDMIRPG
jgi:hypothetical protein